LTPYVHNTDWKSNNCLRNSSAPPRALSNVQALATRPHYAHSIPTSGIEARGWVNQAGCAAQVCTWQASTHRTCMLVYACLYRHACTCMFGTYSTVHYAMPAGSAEVQGSVDQALAARVRQRRPVDSGKGVRIQGGKVYDSKHGLTCHW
jgi:hypothetical protein